eukprot:g5223.t1
MTNADDSILREIAELRDKIYGGEDEEEIRSRKRDPFLRKSAEMRSNPTVVTVESLDSSGDNYPSHISHRTDQSINENSSISEDLYSDDVFESEDEEETEIEEEREYGNESSDHSTSDVELRSLRAEVKMWEEARRRAYRDDAGDLNCRREDHDFENDCRIEDEIINNGAKNDRDHSRVVLPYSSRSHTRRDLQAARAKSRVISDLVPRESGSNCSDSDIHCDESSAESEDAMSSSATRPDDPLSTSQQLQNEIEEGQNKINELRDVLARLRAVGNVEGNTIESINSNDWARLELGIGDEKRETSFVNNLHRPTPQVVDKHRLQSWQKLGLVPWSDRDERRKRRMTAIRKNYNRYFKMIDEGVDAKEIERRMKTKFIGSTVIDVVVKEAKDRERDRRRQRRCREEIASQDTKGNIVDAALGDALSLLMREERESFDVAVGIDEIREAASASRIAAAFAIASVVSIETLVSSLEESVATAKAEFSRLKKAQRTALLGEIRHAREMERERKKQQYRGVPLHERKTLARRRVHRKRRKDLERRMIEAAQRNFDAATIAESAMRKRVSNRVKKMKSLVARDRRSRALVRAKIQKIDAQRARKRQEDSELRSFWKSLIGGNEKGGTSSDLESGEVAALDSTSKAVIDDGE